MTKFSLNVYNSHPIKRLTVYTKSSIGRSKGRIAMRGRCAPAFKRANRLINYTPHHIQDCAQLIRLEYDPNRSALLGLFRFLRSGFLSYLIAPSNMRLGSYLFINFDSVNFHNLNKSFVSQACSFLKPLALFKKGSIVCCIEGYAFSGFKYCRSAGSAAKVQAISKKLNLVELLLPSGKLVYVPGSSYAISGIVNNRQHYNVKLRKAGQSHWQGIRPLSRGVAMNPIDHPHGGGEGKTSGGRPSVSFSALLAKGYKTITAVSKKKQFLIKQRFSGLK